MRLGFVPRRTGGGCDADEREAAMVLFFGVCVSVDAVVVRDVFGRDLLSCCLG